MEKSRGFVTIATGKNNSFAQLAFNLKRTYDFQPQSKRYPWAIITDYDDNKWKIFDKTVILHNAKGSYLDKIEMLSIPPWDENIFIDADCLIYGDISSLFSIFPLQGVRHMGTTIATTEHGRGWFDIDDIGMYKNEITFKIHSHGGIIFFNKDQTTQKVYNTALEISRQWNKLKFREFNKPADEPILALSMCIHRCQPIPLDISKYMYFYRVHRNIKNIDINRGVLSFQNKYNGKLYENVPILHWGTNETNGYLYKSEMLRFNHSIFYLIKKIFWLLEEKFMTLKYTIKSNLYSLLH